MPTTTDLGDYRMVIAVTEQAVNAAMSYATFWGTPITFYLGSPPPVDPTDDSLGLHQVQMAPASVALTGHSIEVGSSQVNVNVSFTGGSVVYFSYDTASMVNQDLTGWSMNFNAPLSQAELPESADISNLPEETQLAISQALSSAVMSVGQLFLDMSSVVWTFLEVTDQNGVIVSDTNFGLTQALVESFQGYIDQQEQTLSQCVINYLISATEPDNTTLIPDLVPTDYNYSVSQYNPSGTEYDDLSTINYLITTNFATPPTGDTAGSFDVNWVPGPNTQNYQGTIAVDGTLFSESYIQPLLLPIIQESLGVNVAFSSATGLCPWTLTKTINHDPVSQLDWWQVALTLGETVYLDQTDKINCNVNLDNFNGVFKVTGSYYSKCAIDVHYWGQSIGGYYQEFTQPWSFDIPLKANTDGSLSLIPENFTLNTDDMVSSDIKSVEYDDGFGHNIQNMLSDILAWSESVFESFGTTYMEECESEFKSGINDIDLTELSTQMNESLVNVSTSIVFPGAATFGYKDLCFTQDSEQNLIGFVSYKS